MPRPSFALGAVALAAAACAWSVPADPGKNAALRSREAGSSRDAVPAADAAAGALYLEMCSKCHEAFPPSHASRGEWPALVRKYGPRAGLFGEERDRVLRWLVARAS